ncbi:MULTISPECIES: glutamine--fructose-6-phosphate transaminase (isomerizing) [Segatella]|jgi:glucosamine--fructose-6-phosphate aminotransferase (isomerizing)|uniref:Glutamine--fructose-6-phosphate aminotransferase [isomerizing] n=2 Tax=Segatella bryantii TaxID=77095 RepID=A0AA37HWT4_SEGBR|nr:MULTISPECIES: glutamine--fructose-6-phosphate transaminase (isomerizing) [Segatella]MBQ3857752.1 glutamine--fructose-6-phosphate transaminase (isomerizing) [Prevotella sp.]MDR4930777.1 glutamine--fructose-6-phosphate transaminase (isomerizing) [Segatella bryantii]MEE3414585.1 glutamine--fructose-6-phosphate transaminase (isomerizing) [Prevotella sp.]OYP53458.1 glutamine--fructose-6-phosphate transaminase (isomerizing) [Segatella bryantii]UKK76917.1 glutamine--fructose-6-phosphate transamina
MCGIVGYLGNREAYPVLIKGLKRLEYRGYDSAGVALINSNDDLNVYKTKGKVDDLENFCSDKDITGKVGIAHTRWATHGEPSSTNAHPHYSESKKLAIIHNGIIENYAEIKKNLIAEGVEFRSETDTEVLIQLIEFIEIKKNLDLLSAVQVALKQVIGAYAIAILDKNNPHQIIAARKQSPLVVGIGKDNQEFFLGSDASPIVEFTDQVVYLEDGNIAVLRLGEPLKVVDIHNVDLNPEVKTVDIALGQIEKGGFPHFMLKEIFEQPECLTNCLRGRISLDKQQVTLSAIIDYKKQLLSAKRIIIVACGTSWHAALIGKQMIETYCRIPVEVEYASEFRYRNPVVTSDDVVIAISQSGETADTLAAVKLAKEKGAFIYGVCNAIGSSIPRATDTGTYIHVGPEIGVASTKAFTGQVTVLTLLALCIAREKNTICDEDYKCIIKGLCEIPDKIREVLQENDRIAELSQTFTYARNFLYLGRGFSYPVALEGALKLKEISYIHAEGYPAAEMKHGPIALIDSDMPCVVIATHNEMYEKILSNIQEVKARKGRVIALVTKGDDTISKIADEVIELPETLECLEPLIATIPLQLLAYHVAVCKGKNVDQPRNLAKSVTVE